MNPVPEPMLVSTGDQGIIGQAMNSFFDSIVPSLGLDVRTLTADVEIISHVLHKYDSHEQVRPTDDRLTILVVQDRVVASVLERRTEFNHIQVLFSRY